MQARLTASRWMKDTAMAPERPFESMEYLKGLRTSVKERGLDVPQYWFNDYAGYMEDVASHLSLLRNDGSFADREGCTSPARYLSKDTCRQEADSVMGDLARVWHDCVENGRFVPRAASRSLQGNWRISRSIKSSTVSFSGTLDGTASFYPRFATKDKSGKIFDLEYLYIEEGTFTPASTGFPMKASRRYVYRYAEAEDQLSVWFVKPDNDLEVDYLFHNLVFISPAEARKEGALVANADHLCVDDTYSTQYRLPMKGVTLHDFQLVHAVRGPQKDYVATTLYTRPTKNDQR